MLISFQWRHNWTTRKLESLLECFTETFINFPAHTSRWNCINDRSGHTWSTLVQSGTHTLRKTSKHLKTCRSLLWGSALNHGTLTILHFLTLLACQHYLTGEKPLSCVFCLIFLQGESYTPPVQSQSKTLPIPLTVVTLYNSWSPVPAPTNTNTHSYHLQYRGGTASILMQMAVTPLKYMHYCIIN